MGRPKPGSTPPCLALNEVKLEAADDSFEFVLHRGLLGERLDSDTPRPKQRTHVSLKGWMRHSNYLKHIFKGPHYVKFTLAEFSSSELHRIERKSSVS